MVWIFSYQQTGTIFNGNNYEHRPPDRNRLNSSSISSKSNLLQLFSQATFPQCYITQCQKLKKLVSSDGLDFFPINKPELISTESTISIYPRTGTAKMISPSFPNRIFCNFSHKPHFHNAISHSAGNQKIWSVPMIWIFFHQQTGNILNRINYKHLPSDRTRMDNPSISSKSNLLQLFSQATFPQCYITYCQKLENWVSSDGQDSLPINKPELFSTESTISISPRTGTG